MTSVDCTREPGKQKIGEFREAEMVIILMTDNVPGSVPLV